jgi:hypothetical protein
MSRKFMPRDAAQARDWLKLLAKNLRDIQAKPDEIPPDFDLANWFADAVDDYTREKPTRRKPRARSMDVALGLKPRPGRAKGTQRGGLQTAIHIHYLRLRGESWKEIAERLGHNEPEALSVRDLQRLCATHADGVIEHLSGDYFVPLGYDLENGKLVINEREAATVRMIFERFAKIGSATKLMLALKAEGITGKRGKPIDEGYLYRLLNNPIYEGEVVHWGMYPGKHKAIVSRTLWNKVRKILSGVTPGRASKTR